MKKFVCFVLTLVLVSGIATPSVFAFGDESFGYEESSSFAYDEPTTVSRSDEPTTVEDKADEDENAVRAGDVDGDGKITATDARIALRLSAKIASAGTFGVILYADANGDGKVTAADARLILRYSAKLENLFALSRVEPLSGTDALGSWAYIYDSWSGNVEKRYYNIDLYGFYNVYTNDGYLSQAQESAIDSDSDGTYYFSDSGVKRYFERREAEDGTYEIWFYEDEDSVSGSMRSPSYEIVAKSDFLSSVITENTVTASSGSSSCRNAFMSWNTDWNSGSAESSFMTVGQTKTFSANVVFRGIKGSWSSSDDSIASVNSDGAVTAKKTGFAVIKYSAGDFEIVYGATVISDVQSKIVALSKKYPAGYYYNNNEKSSKFPYVSEIPCDHSLPTYPASCKGQCAGFAATMSNEVYGSDKKCNYFSDKSRIAVGDYLRVLPHHSVFVIAKINKGEIYGYDSYNGYIKADDDMIVVAECNWDRQCGIDWGRTMYVSDISITGDSYKR